MLNLKDNSVLPPVRNHVHDSRIPKKRRSRENKLFIEVVRIDSIETQLTPRTYTSSPQNEQINS